MAQEGPFQLIGDIYLVDRKVVSGGTIQTPTDYLGGTKVARLEEVLRYKWSSDVHLLSKHGSNPTGARIIGDYIEIELVVTEMSEEFMTLISNKRSTGTNFHKKSGNTYKEGHILRAANYNAVVIRHTPAPTEKPLLYVPYCLTLDTEWFSARAAGHTEQAVVTLSSVDFDGEDAANYDNAAFEYGDVTQFPDYNAGGGGGGGQV